MSILATRHPDRLWAAHAAWTGGSEARPHSFGRLHARQHRRGLSALLRRREVPRLGCRI